MVEKRTTDRPYCPKSGRLFGGVVIKAQHPAEPQSSFHRATSCPYGLLASDEPIIQALMISLRVIVRHELAHGTPQRANCAF